CLMPNHFHLMLEQLVDHGIQKFMHKVLMGYVRYFNLKYDRVGRLYESSYKAKLLISDAQFSHLSRYIHLNPLDLFDKNWREHGIKDWDLAMAFLDQYPWSSHHEFNGRHRGLPVIDDRYRGDLFAAPSEYREFLKEWGVGMENELENCGHSVTTVKNREIFQ
ncbi:MAG: transposase, partial [bacterium]